MKVPLPEIIDRMSILKLKIEYSKNSDLTKEFEKELRECESSVSEFEKEGLKIKQEWIDRLYEINKYQWGLESSMRKLKEEGKNFKEIGKLYIELQMSNKRRVAVKNQISEETGSGFKDININ